MSGDEAARAQAEYAPLAASACCEGLPLHCVGDCDEAPANYSEIPNGSSNYKATLNSSLPTDAAVRKSMPICTGLLDYFPDALAAVAQCSKTGNDQHNPGEPLRWAREKSTDHADCLVRHLIDRGTVDSDGVLHSAKAAWRALALLQLEIENDRPMSKPM